MNDLEDLFNRQPPYSEDDLARIIAHYRETRARYLAGEKLSKPSGPKLASIDLEKLGLKKKPEFSLNLFEDGDGK